MSERWLSWRVFPGGPGREDWALEAILRPLRDAVAAHAELRAWFFIRYFDERGPHLRIRVLAREPDLPSVQTVVEPLFDAALSRVDEVEHPPARSLVRVPDVLQPRGVHLGWEHAIYEPERDKYGGLAGVRMAEEAFATASEAIVDAFVAAPPEGPAQRAAIAVDLLESTVRLTLGDGAGAGALWERYVTYWTHGDTALGRSVRARLEEAVHAVGNQVWAAGPPASSWREASERIAAAVAEACTREAELTGDAQLHLLHHLHMNNNRLGIETVEEALLARLAATSRVPAETARG